MATANKSELQKQIAATETELAQLEQTHTAFVTEAKKTMIGNKVRFIQLNAKLDALKALLPKK